MPKPAHRREDKLNIQESNGIMTQMKIQVEIKAQYGNLRIFPVCPMAHKFTCLTRSKTFTEQDIACIKDLGFIVELVQSPVAVAWAEIGVKHDTQ